MYHKLTIIILMTMVLLAFGSTRTLASDADGLILDEAFDVDINPVQTQADKPPAANDGFYQNHIANKFTFKFSQQIYSQLNPHKTASGVEKRAEIENNRLNINIKYQNPFAAGWNFQASAQAKIYWPSDYEFGTDNEPIDMEGRVENLEARLNEFYLTKSVARHAFKLGRQTIVWGETEGNSILDTLNTTDFRDLSIIEIEDARLNQWFLVWDYFRDDSQRMSTFINFNAHFNPATRKNSPTYSPSPIALGVPEDKPRFEFGSRWMWSVEQSDIALMAAYLYENPLRYELSAESLGTFTAQANDNAYWLFGASANRAIGKLLLKLDLAFSHGALADTLLAPDAALPFTRSSSVRGEQIGASAGFEYALSNEQRLNVSALMRAFPWLDASLSSNEKSANGDVFGTWLMRYSHSFSNGDWLFSSTLNGSINGSQVLVSGGLQYTVNDHWSLLTQAIATWADKNSAFAILDQDFRLGFSVTYSH